MRVGKTALGSLLHVTRWQYDVAYCGVGLVTVEDRPELDFTADAIKDLRGITVGGVKVCSRCVAGLRKHPSPPPPVTVAEAERRVLKEVADAAAELVEEEEEKRALPSRRRAGFFEDRTGTAMTAEDQMRIMDPANDIRVGYATALQRPYFNPAPFEPEDNSADLVKKEFEKPVTPRTITEMKATEDAIREVEAKANEIFRGVVFGGMGLTGITWEDVWREEEKVEALLK